MRDWRVQNKNDFFRLTTLTKNLNVRLFFFTTDSVCSKRGLFSLSHIWGLSVCIKSFTNTRRENSKENDTIKNPLQLFLLEPKLILAAKIRPVCTSAPRPSYNSYSITISFGLFDLAHYYTVLYQIIKSVKTQQGVGYIFPFIVSKGTS